MKIAAIVLILFLGLMDFALLVACSHLEDREQYYHEKHLRGGDDE